MWVIACIVYICCESHRIETNGNRVVYISSRLLTYTHPPHIRQSMSNCLVIIHICINSSMFFGFDGWPLFSVSGHGFLEEKRNINTLLIQACASLCVWLCFCSSNLWVRYACAPKTKFYFNTYICHSKTYPRIMHACKNTQMITLFLVLSFFCGCGCCRCFIYIIA